VLAVFWLLPKIQATGWPTDLREKDRIELEDKARATIGQLVSAVGLVATVAITLISVNGVRSSSRETLRQAARNQTYERFARAIEQLGARGSDNRKLIEVRLGGIYLLEEVGSGLEAPALRPSATAVLTAYIRANAPRRRKFSASPIPPVSERCSLGPQRVPPDIEAALAVLRHFYLAGVKRTDPPALDLSQTELSGADLESMDLRGSNLNGTRLFMAQLRSADLRDARLEGVDARGACFVSTRADRARFINDAGKDKALVAGRRPADLRQAVLFATNLTDAQMSYVDFRGAVLDGAIFTRATVEKALLTGTDPSKVGAGRERLPCGGRNPPCR
jgi:hypothetical protein